MTQTTPTPGRRFGFGVMAVAIAALVFVASKWLWIGVAASDATSDVKLPLILLVSILLLLGAFAVVAIVFSTAGLSRKEHALGLPPGTVRALLAFGLVIVFALMSLNFFSQLGEGAEVGGLTQSQFDALDLDRVLSASHQETEGGRVYTVQLRSVSAGQEELAKQVVTALMTLVAAIAAFYFGSRGTDEKTTEAFEKLAAAAGLMASPPANPST